jgi:uncharacterized protein
MIEFKRYLKLELPVGQSAFLWGARKTGKSLYLKKHFPNSITYDLLNTEVYWRLLAEPQLLRQELLALKKSELKYPVIIDEVQMVPQLLNEVHWLIENSDAYFILCGSSARKLRRDGANMLGGRAWRYHFYPLVFAEIPDFNLQRALSHGLVPSHYLAQNWKKTIAAYVQDYLTEEIKAEGLVRNLAAFAKFIKVAAHSNCELVNFANVAQDCQIDSKTVKEYYQILEDTLLGYFIAPYKDRHKRKDLVATPKFYYFDVGVVNGIIRREITELKGMAAGNALEHYILMELIAYRGLNDLDYEITFWRTRTGLEVDFILGKAEVAIEVKISEHPRLSDLHGLVAFQEEYTSKKAYTVCMVPRKRKLQINESQSIDLLPVETFLKMLWKGEII